MRLRTLLSLAATALMLTIVAVSWRDRTRAARAVAAPEQPAEPSSEMAALTRDVALLKAKSATPQVLVLPVGDKPKEEAPAPAPDPLAARAEAEAQVKAVTETLERKYATEPVDHAWSEKQTNEIRSAIGAHCAGTMIASAQCASSLCKVVLQHDSAAIQRGLATEVANLPPMQVGVFYQYDEDPNQLRTTLYVLREGFDLRQL